MAEGRVEPEVVEPEEYPSFSGFGGIINVYDIFPGENSLDLYLWFRDNRDKILKMIKTGLKKHRGVKVQLKLRVWFINHVGEEIDHTFNTKQWPILNQVEDLDEGLDMRFGLLHERISDYQGFEDGWWIGSGWTIKRIGKMEVWVVKYDPLAAYRS